MDNKETTRGVFPYYPHILLSCYTVIQLYGYALDGYTSDSYALGRSSYSTAVSAGKTVGRMLAAMSDTQARASSAFFAMPSASSP